MIRKVLPYFIILLSIGLVGYGFAYKWFPSNASFLSLKEAEPMAHSSFPLKETSPKSVCKKKPITIQNGCGVSNLGRTYKKYLISKNYDVDKFIDAPNFGHTSTKIYFHKNNKNCAISLANELGIDSKFIKQETNLDYYHDLTLILGKDYKQLSSYASVKKHNPFK